MGQQVACKAIALVRRRTLRALFCGYNVGALLHVGTQSWVSTRVVGT